MIKVQTSGFEKLRSDRGCLWLCNHPSLIDYVIITALFPELTCMVKGSLWRNPFLGATIRDADYIPNDTTDELLALCRERLDAGENILIFPEGTRTPTLDQTSQPPQLKRGAANIALRCQADVRFIHIEQAPRFLTKEQKWYYVPPNTSVYKLSAGEYLPYSEFACEDPEQIPLQVRKLTKCFAHKLTETKSPT